MRPVPKTETSQTSSAEHYGKTKLWCITVPTQVLKGINCLKNTEIKKEEAPMQYLEELY